MIISTLEQFERISLISLNLLNFDFSITNLFLIIILTLGIFSSIVFFLSPNTSLFEAKSFFFIPNSWQFMIETLYEIVSKLLFDNINIKGEKYFPFISVIFTFILFNNLIGLISYSFTVTSHLFVTFTFFFLFLLV